MTRAAILGGLGAGLLLLTGNCAGDDVARKPAPGFDKRWTSNADGFVFSAGYFTEAEIRSGWWEKQRRGYLSYAHFCDEARVVHRDVVWFDPARTGGARCARVVYSLACPNRRAEWGTSLAYARKDAMLREIERGIGANCGDKFATRIRSEQGGLRELRRAALARLIDPGAGCGPEPDKQQGVIRIGENSRLSQRVLVAPAFANAMADYWQADAPRRWIEGGAGTSGTVHAVFSDWPLVDDGANIFITAVYAMDGDGQAYCVTLSARQGANAWRRTIRRPHLLAVDRTGVDAVGHALDPDNYWTPDGDMHRLSEELVLALGLPLVPSHDAGARRRGTGADGPDAPAALRPDERTRRCATNCDNFSSIRHGAGTNGA